MSEIRPYKNTLYKYERYLKELIKKKKVLYNTHTTH